jgi:DNA-3-methyladenine glycosylase II
MKYDFDVSSAVQHISRRDRQLAALIARVGPFEPELRAFADPFEALSHAIIFQQLTAKAAAAIHHRLLARFPEQNHPTPSDMLALSDGALREVGLSKAKTVALRDLAQHASDGRLPDALQIHDIDDDTIIERCSAVKGIGAWTVQMMLIYYLGRANVLPSTDLGIRKGYLLTFGGELPQPSAITRRAQRWDPYRTVASLYLWQATYL